MKNSLHLGILLTCLSPIVITGGFWNRYWFGPWAVLLAMIAIGFSIWVGLRLHWTLVPITLSTIVSGLWIFGWANNPYSNLSITDQAAIKDSALYAVFAFVMLIWLAVMLGKYSEQLKLLLAEVCALAVISTFIQIAEIPFRRAGFLGNASMNGCLIAITLPFLLEVLPGKLKALMLFPCIAVLMTGASIPVGVLCVVLMVMFINRWKIALLSCCIPVVIAFASQGAAFLNSSGRFNSWKIIMKWWAEQYNPLVGAGAGTSTVLLSIPQREAGITSFYMWMHNDVLQVVFEQGLIGLACLIIATISVLRIVRNDRTILSACFGFIATAFFNYPTHLAPTALVGACLLSFCANPIRSTAQIVGREE